MIPGGRDIKVFTGTMDKDTEARYLGAPNYRHLLNARSNINSQGTFGAIEDVMGNVLVNNPFLANGRNKVIGSYEDIAGQSCIFFVWNEFGFHGIFRWYANRVGFPNGEIEKIYRVANPTAYDEFNPNPLNFQENNLIVGVNLVGNLLYWTDGFNDPKYINIDKANETNKKREFELYLNDLSFDVNTTYSVVISLNLVTISTISWSVVANTNLQARINDAFNALSASPLLNVTNKQKYLLLQCTNVGDYRIDIVDSTPNQSLVIPSNFYADFPEYAPLNHQLFSRIKYPPFCAPTCNFLNVFEYTVNTPLFTLGNGLWVNSSLGAPTGFYNYPANQSLSLTLSITFTIIGWNANSTFDIFYGNVLVYSHSALQGNGTFSINTTFAYINPLVVNPLTLTAFIKSVTANVAGGTFSAVQVVNNLLLWNVGVAPTNAIGSVGLVPVVWYFGFDLTGGTVNAPTRNQFGITYTTPLYRIKYIYTENQNSVYSTYSSIVLPTNIQSNYLISILYNDKRLTDLGLLCDIKSVVIAQSIDDGTTWFDIVELDRHKWVGTNKQRYLYDGNTLAIPVPTEEAILQYHAVPLTSKSQEYISERIFDGNITEGYDAINIEAFHTVTYKNISDNDIVLQRSFRPYVSASYWKRGHEGKLGIVYYDDADRKTAVCTYNNNDLNIDYYTANNNQNFNPATVSLTIASEPPIWAKKYQIVRTNDNIQKSYLIFNSNSYRYVDKNGNSPANPSLIKYLIINLDQLPFYTTTENIGAKINYTYTSGDRIRFICDNNSNFFIYNDALIVQSLNNEIWILTQDLNVIFNAITQPSILFELYSPNYKSTDAYDLYYEFGECYEIGETTINGQKVKYHKGNNQDQDIQNNLPAIVDIQNGNVYYRNQDFFYGVPVLVPATFQYYISSQQPYDQNENLFYANGRPNTTQLKGRVHLKTALRFSDIFNPSLQNKINGLSVNQPLNILTLTQNYGALNKMQVVNNDVLKLVFGNSYQVSIYVNQGVIRQTQGAGNLISLSDEVAGNSHIIQRTLGTINGESVIVNDEGDMFGYDENEGVVWISSGNGLIQISDRGMKSIFKNYSNQRKATGGVSETPAVYDLYHDEYIITLGNIVGGDNFEGVTIAYNKQKQGWTSYYSFVPEYYGRVRDFIVSFKDGQLWKHDANVVAKNFYGVQYPRSLTFVSNKDFPKVKDYKAMSVNGLGENDVPVIIIPPFQGYLSGMLSSLSKRFFQTLEGIQYAYFQKDKLSPGFGGNQLNALVNGRNLKGQTIEVTLVNTDSAKSSIYSADIVYFYSEHS